MSATRLSGFNLGLKVDSKEYMAETSEWEVTEEEKDGGTVTFADAAQGSSGQKKLKVTVVQSLTATALQQVVMDNPAKRDVAFTLAPAGNPTPSAEEPHFTGTLNFPKFMPKFGIAAGEEDAKTEIEFPVVTWKKITSAGVGV